MFGLGFGIFLAVIIVLAAFESTPYKLGIKGFISITCFSVIAFTLIVVDMCYDKIYDPTEIVYTTDLLKIRGKDLRFNSPVTIYETYYDTPWYFVGGGRSASSYIIVTKEK